MLTCRAGVPIFVEHESSEFQFYIDKDSDLLILPPQQVQSFYFFQKVMLAYKYTHYFIFIQI